MSMTLYFAKLNLISEDIFNLYDNPAQRNAIAFSLYQAINANKYWEKENIFYDDNGNPHSTIIEYSAHILRMDQTSTYIEGWIYKKSRLYYKTLDKSTNTLMPQSTESTEGNRFALDLKHGYVGYNTSTRFGYKEFVEAFVNLVNLGEESLGYAYRYNMSLCVKGINLNELKNELYNMGHIKELKIRMQSPNPSEDLLDILQERCDGFVKDLKDANVTIVERNFYTDGAMGIDLDAPLINDTLDDLQGLHSGLQIEESTKKGYISVEATETSGKKYSSGESKPIKRIIDGLEVFFDTCIDAFHQLR